ncbi:2'-5' RNA ligase family protein [Azospirillum sp. ST 5-10]|uniref:2'-5' RNA ligase family protein n=1 Tax=unclassified Azospirillum TaxID=2630922 RepID=UPI003F4A02B9
MQIAVIAEPLFRESDRLWIEAVRERHDPQHRRVRPHFTLVFPQSCGDPAPIIEHVEEVTARHTAMAAHLRVAVPVKDHLGTATHVYLMPDEGFSALVRLHDDLHRNVLADSLRLDVPYMPHVTVAVAEEAAAAKAIADGLNARAFDVACQIDAVSVVRCDTAHLQVLTRIGLADGPHPPPVRPC